MSGAAVQVPLDVLEQLRGAAAQMGIDLPGVTKFAPKINVTMSIRMLADEMGRLLGQRNLFLHAGDVVTVDAETGEIRRMTARRLPGWAEEWVSFEAPGARRVRESLSPEDAAQILEMDNFRGWLRPLVAVHEMVLPVTRANGETEFLKPGYDVESQIYTLELVPYAQDWELKEAIDFLCWAHVGFPWLRTEVDLRLGASQYWLAYNRSFGVHLMALVGQYCRAMFPPGTLFPIIAYFANKPGTGKTRLAEIAVTAVHGFAASTGAPKDDEKMDVKLETIAQSMSPYLILDDIGGGLRSNPLNRFTTESWHSGRVFHSNKEMFKAPNVTQVFVTANDLKTSEDIDRRALIVELFLDTDVKGRKFAFTITPQWLSAAETRGKFLAACNALVRHWLGKGRPVHDAPLETYEEWTRVIAGIVMAADFADPLQVREGVVGGSMEEDEIRQLLIEVATEADEDCSVSRKDLIDAAREHGLLEDLVGAKGSGDLDAAANKRFGRRMQRWRGQKIKDKNGRTFEFGHKRMKSGATYPLRFDGVGVLPAVTAGGVTGVLASEPTEVELLAMDEARAEGDAPADTPAFDPYLDA